MRLCPLIALLALSLSTLTACKGGDDGEGPDDDGREDSSGDSGGADSEAKVEDCTSPGDEDGDGQADCEDDDCAALCVEDCADGLDNDKDGLTDCEDDECLDVCGEDCSDTVDNDKDGAIDCEDDECQGDAACPKMFLVEANVELGDVRLAWGEGLRAQTGVAATIYIDGEVSLTGVAMDGSGITFTCSGVVHAYPTHYGLSRGYVDLISRDCDGCDYPFEMVNTLENHGVHWEGKCPVDDLPTSQLGFFLDGSAITRYHEDTGAWSPQYDVRIFGQYLFDYGYGDVNLMFLSVYPPLYPVAWEVGL